MRRRAGAAVTGLRRRLSPGSSAPPTVPVYFNLLSDAEPLPKTGRVGEQRLLLVQDLAPDAARDGTGCPAGCRGA